jgi:hypothetical protein
VREPQGKLDALHREVACTLRLGKRLPVALLLPPRRELVLGEHEAALFEAGRDESESVIVW